MRGWHQAVVVTMVLIVGSGFANAQPLTAESLERFQQEIDVTPDELRWQKVQWRSYWEGLIEAQRADRPIFYWIYFGDPRSGC